MTASELLESASEMLESASELMESLSQSAAAERGQEVATVAWKLARSVGKAAWIAGTTFLVLGLPLLFALEREAALVEMESLGYGRQDEMQALLLGTTSSSLPQ